MSTQGQNYQQTQNHDDDHEEGEIESESSFQQNQTLQSLQVSQQQQQQPLSFLAARGRGGGGSMNYYQMIQQKKSQQQMTFDQQMNNQTPTGYQQQNLDSQNQNMEQPNVIGNESDFYEDDEYIEARGENQTIAETSNNAFYNQNHQEDFKEPVQPNVMFKGLDKQLFMERELPGQYFELDQRLIMQQRPQTNRRNSFSTIQQMYTPRQGMNTQQQQPSNFTTSINESANTSAINPGQQQNQTIIQQQYHGNNIIGQSYQDGQTINKVFTDDLARLMRSKKDIYEILTIEGQYYLPPYLECTVMYLRDLFAGKKKCIKNEQVRIISVPRLSELSATNLIKDVLQDPLLRNYLPEIKEKRGINRQFLFNIINTVKPTFFPENIRNSLAQRKVMAAEKKKRYVELTSELYELVMNTNRLQQGQRGRAIHMLNVGAKKRKQPDRSNQNQIKLQLHLNQVESEQPNMMIGQQPSKRFKPNDFNYMNAPSNQSVTQSSQPQGPHRR